MTQLHRITTDPEQLGGRPCLRSLGVRVTDVLELLARGVTRAAILADYVYLEDEDITAALEYAARLADLPMHEVPVEPATQLPEPVIVETYIGGACPTQSEGTVDGLPYYFRARHGVWRLEIDGIVVVTGIDESGGWMDDGMVREIIRTAARKRPFQVAETRA